MNSSVLTIVIRKFPLSLSPSKKFKYNDLLRFKLGFKERLLFTSAFIISLVWFRVEHYDVEFHIALYVSRELECLGIGYDSKQAF